MADDGEQVTLVLPSGEKQSFLIPSGMSDNEAKLFVRSKRPDLFKTPEQQAPDATAQARAFTRSQIKPLIPGTGTIDPSGGLTEKQKSPAYQDYMNASGAMAGGAAGGMLGGKLTPFTAGLPAAIRALATGSSIGVGTGLGQLATDPTHPGAALSAAAGTTMVGTALPPLVKWMTSSKSAGAKALQAASAKAGDAPVELSPKTNELIEEIVREGKSGGTVPKVVTDLLDRVGPSTRQAADATPGPLTYNEARSFQSNLSQLSTSEQMALKGRMKSLIPEAAKSFAKDVQAGADAAGAGPEHAIGMREYAQASSRNRVLTKAGKAAGIGAGVGGTLYEIAKMMQRSTP